MTSVAGQTGTVMAPAADARMRRPDVVSDGEGAATFAPFLPANTIEPDGRVGGNVVYVLDRGAHDKCCGRDSAIGPGTASSPT